MLCYVPSHRRDERELFRSLPLLAHASFLQGAAAQLAHRCPRFMSSMRSKVQPLPWFPTRNKKLIWNTGLM